MSSGSLSWLHKIELVISNISTPEGKGGDRVRETREREKEDENERWREGRREGWMSR